MLDAAQIPQRLAEALAAHRAGRLEQARSQYLQVVRAEPRHFDALHLLGVMAFQDRQPQDSLDWLDRAIAVDEANAECWSNRGLALQALDRLDEALASFDRAVFLKPDFAKAHYNRGNVLQEMQRVDEAIAGYEAAIAIRPDFADAQLQRAQCRLLIGDFAQGWQGYEWRWQCANFAPYRREFAQPAWRGDAPLTGKTLLLYAEQGLGDTLQFCRYASLAAEAGARVVLEANASLAGLFTDRKSTRLNSSHT